MTGSPFYYDKSLFFNVIHGCISSISSALFEGIETTGLLAFLSFYMGSQTGSFFSWASFGNFAVILYIFKQS
jgi:hypothetical protein